MKKTEENDLNIEYLKSINYQKQFKKLCKKLKNKTVILYGAGIFFELINELCDLKKLNIIGISDKRFENSNETSFKNYKVIKPSEIFKYRPSYLLITTKYYVNIIYDFLINNPKSNARIIPIFKKPYIDYRCENENHVTKLYSIYESYGLKFPIYLCKKYIKFNNQKEISRFQKKEVRKNSVLIVEMSHSHGEVLPTTINYFHKLGYKIDVLINKDLVKSSALDCVKNYDLNISKLNINNFQSCFLLEKIKEYEYIFFNTCENLDKHFNLSLLKNKPLCNVHHMELFNRTDCTPFILANLKNDFNGKMLNPHYFGNIKITNKNKKTNFIAVGTDSKKRNYDLLIENIRKLIKEKLNFQITIIGYYIEENFPKDIKPYIKLLEHVPYPKLYKEVEKSDYILALLDSENENHRRYITIGTSGTFQLVYGFLKPCIIQRDFTKVHGFNDENSLIYEKNEDMYEQMKKAIDLSQNSYKKLQDNLKILAQKIDEQSFDNFKEGLKISKK